MKRKIVKLENTILRIRFLGRKVKRVGIVSCDRFRGKVLDDLLLQRYFLKHGVRADIISWQDKNISYNDYDGLIIGSMWGYQNYLKDFSKWLGKVSDTGLVVINSLDVIRENYDKAEQFKLLRRAGLPIIDTSVIAKGDFGRFKFPNRRIVIKPAISGSGENTFLVNDQNVLDKISRKLFKINAGRELLVQPFMPEIVNGELAIVIIDGKIVNAIRRFPGVLEGEYRVELVPLGKLPREACDLADRVLALPAYQQAIYFRVDMVFTSEGYKLMEVEAFEPQLYYYLLDNKSRDKMLKLVFDVMIKKLASET